jgi:hypothetical protein
MADAKVDFESMMRNLQKRVEEERARRSPAAAPVAATAAASPAPVADAKAPEAAPAKAEPAAPVAEAPAPAPKAETPPPAPVAPPAKPAAEKITIPTVSIPVKTVEAPKAPAKAPEPVAEKPVEKPVEKTVEIPAPAPVAPSDSSVLRVEVPPTERPFAKSVVEAASRAAMEAMQRELLKRGLILVRKTFSKGKILLSEGDEVEFIETPAFIGPAANVSIDMGQTINQGDYNSAKVSVFVSVPCHISEIDEAFQYVRGKAAEFLNREVAGIRSDTL